MRKHMTLYAQKLKMRCAYTSDVAAVCANLKTMSKLTAVYRKHVYSLFMNLHHHLHDLCHSVSALPDSFGFS